MGYKVTLQCSQKVCGFLKYFDIEQENKLSFSQTAFLQNDGVPALVTLKKGLVALARQWMKFIVVTQGFKAIGLIKPNQLTKPKEPQQSLGDTIHGLDNGAALQSDTSGDGAEFEYDAGGSLQPSGL